MTTKRGRHYGMWLALLLLFPFFGATGAPGSEADSGGTTLGTAHLSIHPLSLPFSSAWIAPATECVDCSLCWVDEQAGNKAPPGDDTSVHEIGAGSHYECFPSGGCAANHPINQDCIGGGGCFECFIAELEAVRAAVVAGDVGKARSIAESGDERVIYVPERNAVQALGCEDQVIAHIPLHAGALLLTD